MPDYYDEDGNWIGHVLRQEEPAENCPQSIEGRCMECSEDLEIEYGFCKYGLGAFYRCMSCSTVYDFEPDEG